MGAGKPEVAERINKLLGHEGAVEKSTDPPTLEDRIDQMNEITRYEMRRTDGTTYGQLERDTTAPDLTGIPAAIGVEVPWTHRVGEYLGIPRETVDDAVRIERLAQLCHEANRYYCSLFLNDHAQVPWLYAPAWQQDSMRLGIRSALSGATPQEQHEAWMRTKVADGWVWGPTKNPALKQHPCLLSYDQLPEEQKIKDYLCLAIVRAITGVT